MSTMDAKKHFREDVDWMLSNGLIGLDAAENALKAVRDTERDWHDIVTHPPVPNAGEWLLVAVTDCGGHVRDYKLAKCHAECDTRAIWTDVMGYRIDKIAKIYRIYWTRLG